VSGSDDEQSAEVHGPRTVSQQIISDFLSALSKKEGHSEIANRLHRLLLLEADFSAESIASIIFSGFPK